MNGGDAEPRVDARPTKRFFVRMLVRDIELVPAIVDLVDNSVDGAKRLAATADGVGGSDEEAHVEGDDTGGDGGAPLDPSEGIDLSRRHVTISVGEEEFKIEDDCGGIELSDAIGYAFRFGRPEEVESVEGEVGQFGVGMKRALFKLGEEFEVESYAATSSFHVKVDVASWQEDEDDWSFPLVASAEGEQRPEEERRTIITVRRLLPSVSAEFGTETFRQRLRDQIEFRHQSAIANGLSITLNEDPLQSRPLGLLATDGLAPRVVSKELVANGDSLRLRLYAGFVKLTDEGADTDDPDQFGGGTQAGWYLICNGRMLLFADRSRLTGWGVEVAEYHPQYRRFRGYAYLQGSSSAMPWNTAKTAVDEDSPIWPLVRHEIVEALREARTVMNRIKAEVQDNPPDSRPVTTKLAAAEQTPLADLAESSKMEVPPKPPKVDAATTRITYGVPRDEFEEVAASLENGDTAAEVGRRTFDYYYRREVAD